ncbi:SH3 domain-containing protein [Algoriella xinjiangensis]|uniref:SH3 domain-containing protein n=1 Tax=Algoriella xinjiangensis TaxID=684065 RepID=A0A1I4TIN9_9FLAO|nr:MULTISPECIES: C40 family peptidase [Algoriella]MBO6212283.1 C40 family peptidase [Algoriella sp.]SFM76420.1 SH3 domain-containing protein [Algoriella xinjiangensis]
MKYAICQVSVSPLRAEARDSSEMVSQILFGERLIILEELEKWTKVQLAFDGYEGWVDPKQILTVSEAEYLANSTDKFAINPYNHAMECGLPMTLTIGAEVRSLRENKISIGPKCFEYFGVYTSGKKSKEQLVEIAKAYLNVPYLWGGKSSFGIDCSGLTQQVYKIGGYKIPRDAYEQAEMGEVLSFVEEAEPGDLAFFDNADGKIIHVGIMCGNGKILHAHGKVRIDPIDTNGIFNTDSQKYSHRLRCIRKII